MIKKKVHELAKDLGIQSKDILLFLNGKGIDAKVAQSSLEEESVAMVMKEFGKSTAKPETKSAGKPETNPEANPMGKAKAKSEGDAAEKTATKTVAAEKTVSEAKAAPMGMSEDEPKKKKKIIFVSNPQNSNISGSRSGGGNRPGGGQSHAGNTGGGNRSANSGHRSGGHRKAETPHRIIKPLTAPSMPERTQPERKPLNQPPRNVKPESVNGAVLESGIAELTVPEVKDTDFNTAAVRVTDGAAFVPTTEERAGDKPRPGVSGADSRSSSKAAPRREQGGQPARGYRPEGESGQTRNYEARTDRGERTYQSRSNSPQGARPVRSESGRRPEGGYRQDGTRRPEGGYRQGQDSARRPEGGYRQDGARRPEGGFRPGQDGARRPEGGYRQGQDGARRPEGGYRPSGTGTQGDRRGPSNYAHSGRSGGSDGRFDKGNERPDGRFARPSQGKGVGESKNTGKDSAKHREEEKRRINQEKDKRNKKDFSYEEDGAKTSPRRKVGAFIRPEKQINQIQEEQIKVIVLPEMLMIKELAEKMKIQPAAIVKKLFLQGQVVTVNTEISYEEAENIAIEYDIICEQEVKVDIIEELLKEEDENETEMIKRAPIICVMGHVDHGKTSLLDAIRKTHVTERESGGITQHIGAYTVAIHDQKITFLDTPGHEAFTAMRMRGATATDIAILVVAADDGVMPQTVEAISHAKAAGIEIVVAVNKIDKPSANMDRVKQEMTEHELIPTDWGGTTEYVPVSAKTGEGIENLLETILLTAEIMELKANPNRQARGLVIEAELDKGRGPVATVLVQKGTLHVGDFISAGACHGKVRAMVDDKGRRVKEAFPSTPVEILGLSDVPGAGEIFISHETDKIAKNYAETYQAQNKVKMLEDTKTKMSLDDLFTRIQAGNLKELNIIVKADVQGSVEAVKQSLLKLSNEEVVVKCIHGGVGAINESDVSLASTSSAIIIGFNVRPDVTAKASAEREGVDIRLYKVIYQAIEDIEAAMKGMLDPVFEEKVLGHAEIRQIFRASAVGNIAGSYILDGVFQRNNKVRITRDGEQIFEGELASLKRFKDDVKEVRAGYECGLVFEGFDQVQELDIVEAYTMVEVPR